MSLIFYLGLSTKYKYSMDWEYKMFGWRIIRVHKIQFSKVGLKIQNMWGFWKCRQKLYPRQKKERWEMFQLLRIFFTRNSIEKQLNRKLIKNSKEDIKIWQRVEDFSGTWLMQQRILREVNQNYGWSLRCRSKML